MNTATKLGILLSQIPMVSFTYGSKKLVFSKVEDYDGIYVYSYEDSKENTKPEIYGISDELLKAFEGEIEELYNATFEKVSNVKDKEVVL